MPLFKASFPRPCRANCLKNPTLTARDVGNVSLFRKTGVEGRVSRGNFSFPLDTRHVLLSTLPALWDHLSESRDGNRRPFESAIRTVGQRRIRREFKWQRSTRSYLPGDRRVGSYTGAFLARVKLILPQKCRANEELHIADRV